ncbi:MAG TPA: hypothetical protein VJK51_04920 [Candidatus Nanoarchaeia archaeon]|nr:hypothetical protein [Candidatus Nanoarchaeia archaeon]
MSDQDYRKAVVFMDSSFLQSSFQERIYDTTPQLPNIKEEDIKKAIARIEKISKINRKVLVIPETITELKRGMEILGNQIDFAATHNGDRKKIDGLYLYKERIEDQIEAYLSTLYYPTDTERERYESVFSLAIDRNRDFEKEKKLKKEAMRSGQDLGNQLQTSQRLVAAVITQADSIDAVLATLSSKKENLIKRVYNALHETRNEPRYSIFVWNTDYERQLYVIKRRGVRYTLR